MKRSYVKPSKDPAGVNKTEALYYREHILANGKTAEHEGVVIKLAERCVYTPDWVEKGRNNTILAVHEVKGGWQSRDAKVRFKWASTVLYEVPFYWAVYKNKQWKIEEWRNGTRVKKARGR